MMKSLEYRLARMSAPKQRMLEMSLFLSLRALASIIGHIMHKGIMIVEIPKFSNPGDGDKIIAALSLIERFDQRRFKRIEREIKAVVLIRRRVGIALYSRLGRLCLIDLPKLNQELSTKAVEPSIRRHGRPPHFEEKLGFVRLGAVSSMLVHEATHGAIESRRIPYVPKSKERIEFLCKTEERRFRSRLPLEYDHRLEEFVQPFRDKQA